MGVALFISCVSSEFSSYRKPLRDALTLPDVHVKMQEDFRPYGDDTLAMIEDHAARCDGIVHFIGEEVGWTPPAVCVERLLGRRPELAAKLERLGPARAGLDRLKALARHPRNFDSVDNLIATVFRSTINDALIEAGHATTPRQPNSPPYGSLGSLFKGRDDFLAALRAELLQTGRGAVAGKAGMGSAASARRGRRSNMRCATPATIRRCCSSARRRRSGSIPISPRSPAPPCSICRTRRRGRISARSPPCSAGSRAIRLGALSAAARGRPCARHRAAHGLSAGVLDLRPRRARPRPGARFPIAAHAGEAREGGRRRRPGGGAGGRTRRPRARARTGRAYIAHRRIGFTRYLALWREKRESMLAWFDPLKMSYAHDVGLAATWATSVARLDASSRRLLDRLAYLAPAPIPKFLLDVRADGDDLDAAEALPGLYAYSLASSAVYEDAKVRHEGFVVHRLAQDYARRAMDEGRRGEALAWMSAAFVGDPQDVRTWPRLDPLAPHALAAAEFGDAAGAPPRTGRLFNQLGMLFNAKARYRAAETAKRRALAISEAALPPDDPEIAADLNNLAALLHKTNRAAEAEPLYRRALKIDEASYGPDHPRTRIVREHLKSLGGGAPPASDGPGQARPPPAPSAPRPPAAARSLDPAPCGTVATPRMPPRRFEACDSPRLPPSRGQSGA